MTDNFPLFLVRIQEPVISGIANKTELLGSVKRLYLEHTAKEEMYDMSYDDLFNYQKWDLLGGKENMRVKRRDWQGAKETLQLAVAWRSMTDKYGQPKRIFNSLRTLATGAIFGQQEEIWRSIGGRFDEWTHSTFNTQRATLNFILHTPSIRHYCQAGSVGPLNIGVTYIGDLNQNRPTIASHNHFHDPTLLPTSIGVRSRWYVHTQPGDPGCNEAMFIRWAQMNVEDALRNRRNFSMDRPYAEKVPEWGLVGGVYRNYPQKAGASAYKRTIGPVLDRARRELPPWVTAKDDWESLSLAEAPLCDGCSWAPNRA